MRDIQASLIEVAKIVTFRLLSSWKSALSYLTTFLVAIFISLTLSVLFAQQLGNWLLAVGLGLGALIGMVSFFATSYIAARTRSENRLEITYRSAQSYERESLRLAWSAQVIKDLEELRSSKIGDYDSVLDLARRVRELPESEVREKLVRDIRRVLDNRRRDEISDDDALVALIWLGNQSLGRRVLGSDDLAGMARSVSSVVGPKVSSSYDEILSEIDRIYTELGPPPTTSDTTSDEPSPSSPMGALS